MIFLTLSFLLYFAPALLATSRRSPNAVAIWLTNFFVGWTIIGWVITLIWALNTPPLPYTAATVSYVPVYTGAPVAAPPTVSTPGYTSADAGSGAMPGWSPVSAPDSHVVTDAVRTCVACGRAVPADARFCPACGSVESRIG